MAKATEIFNLLVEKQSLVVKTGTQSKHDSLRTRLVKLFSRHKKLLGDIGVDDGSNTLSMCAEFVPLTGISTFTVKIAEKVIGKEQVDYEIILPSTLPAVKEKVNA